MTTYNYNLQIPHVGSFHQKEIIKWEKVCRWRFENKWLTFTRGVLVIGLPWYGIGILTFTSEHIRFEIRVVGTFFFVKCIK
jgi:hypothetical protein